MSKPMLVTLPCVLLLLDWWPLARLNRSNVWKIVREKISFLVLTVASCVATVIAQHQSGALRPASQYPIIERVGNAALAYVRYLGKTFWPVDLAVYYPYPTQTPWAQMFVAAVLFAGLTFLIYRWSRNRPFLIVGWLWFAGMLVPVIGLVQVGGQSLADRYTYLPSIGLLVVLVFGAHELLTIKAGTAGRIIFPVVAMILVAYSLRTRDQLQHWRDTEKLFRHALAVTRENEVAHNNLGAWLATEGRYAEAMQHYEQALRINPAYADARNNLGTSLAAGNRFEEAIAQYKFALRADPRHADAHRGIGSAYFALGRIAEAEKHFQTAFQLEPGAAETYNALAGVLARQGRAEEAIATFRRANAAAPNFFDAHWNLGLVLMETGRSAEAAASFREALRLKPENVSVLNQLAVALIRLGQFEEARSQLAAARKLAPSDAETVNNLGILAGSQGKGDEAASFFRQALALNPNHENARRNLDMVFGRVPTNIPPAPP